jgi:glutamine phosphoribosylpyrophosphate amidotransferase
MKHALLIAAVAASVSTANAMVNNCAVVLKTPDGFLNVRDAPGMKSTVIGRLNPGDLVGTSKNSCFSRAVRI